MGRTLMGDCEAEKLEGIRRSRTVQTHLKAMLKMLFAAAWALQQELWVEKGKDHRTVGCQRKR